MKKKSDNPAEVQFYTSVSKKSILFNRVSKILQCLLSVCTSIFFWCVCLCALWKCLSLLDWDFADAKHVVFQIRPSDGGYGFTLEEKNRVPMIKSVEKGSPAEVRWKEQVDQWYYMHNIYRSTGRVAGWICDRVVSVGWSHGVGGGIISKRDHWTVNVVGWNRCTIRCRGAQAG